MWLDAHRVSFASPGCDQLHEREPTHLFPARGGLCPHHRPDQGHVPGGLRHADVGPPARPVLRQRRGALRRHQVSPLLRIRTVIVKQTTERQEQEDVAGEQVQVPV